MKERIYYEKNASLMLALAPVGSMGVSAMAANDTDNTMVISPETVVAEAQLAAALK